ncbi:MAG: protein-L-isoaspartate(D-aspartate) O-methyltransferase [Rubripirellula sp.]|nr:protein-L-isoaspartate(D-aspartate) O-methyltransferase [Rubripirellula sp.]
MNRQRPFANISRRRVATMKDPDRQQQRQSFVNQQLASRDIRDPQVLAAMGRVARHEFVQPQHQSKAYDDCPLPIGHHQTISQPYIVALMTQLVAPRANSVALDVGSGSGYQAAVLAEIVSKVYSIEIVDTLAHQASMRLQRLDYQNTEVRAGDGYQGWPDRAPFDVIILAAAPNHVPPPLIEQLKPGGKLVLPVGDQRQVLMLIEKHSDGSLQEQAIIPVVFVPMTGPSLS